MADDNNNCFILLCTDFKESSLQNWKKKKSSAITIFTKYQTRKNIFSSQMYNIDDYRDKQKEKKISKHLRLKKKTAKV